MVHLFATGPPTISMMMDVFANCSAEPIFSGFVPFVLTVSLLLLLLE